VSALPLAASVIVARQTESGLELYMTRRSARSTFVPYAVVFPGGKVDPADASPQAAARTLGLESDRLSAEFRAREPQELPADGGPVDAAQAAALSIAAVRELFEEAGILLARDADAVQVPAAAVHAGDVQAARERIRRGELPFAEFLAQHDWYADARELAYFSHWITPPTEPRRYNTHFFLAHAPLDQLGVADAYETHDGTWIAPSDALDQYREGKLHLVYPTIKHLERLVAFDRLDALLAFARNKDVITIMPSGSPYDDFEMPSSLEGTW
jgi:8-oxo-dGTP pyrophosphatase MutT (NUDIX family)